MSEISARARRTVFEKGDILYAIPADEIHVTGDRIKIDPKAIKDLTTHPVILLDVEREGYCVIFMVNFSAFPLITILKNLTGNV